MFSHSQSEHDPSHDPQRRYEIPSSNVNIPFIDNDNNATTVEQSTSTAMRPISRGVVPLEHPAPGLESLKGAYTHNVELLEFKAERLSMGSNLGDEIEKLKLQLRDSDSQRTRLTPVPNVDSRSSAESDTPKPQGEASSASSSSTPPIPPHHSLPLTSKITDASRDRYRTQQDSNHEVDQSNGLLNLDFDFSSSRFSTEFGLDGLDGDAFSPLEVPLMDKHLDSGPHPSTPPPHDPEASPDAEMGPTDENEGGDRRASVASDIIEAQAVTLFEDFDGVHFEPSIHENEGERASASEGVGEQASPMSLRPNRRKSIPLPPNLPTDDMVFYPAPVPKVLNLPQRISTRPPPHVSDRRKSQVLNALFPEEHQAAELAARTGRPNSVMPLGAPHRQTINLAALPPQLRASVFFDKKPVQHSIQMTDPSAVRTLDNLLEEAAYTAPELLSKPKQLDKEGDRRKSIMSVGGLMDQGSKDPTVLRRKSTLSLNHLTAGEDYEVPEGGEDRQVGEDNDDQLEGRDGEDSDDDDGLETGPTTYGRPETLMAELQIRKHELTKRTRNAATAFPNGMAGTLLEMDDVLQKEKQKRMNGRIALAWDTQPEDEDDDVPLHVLQAREAEAKTVKAIADRPQPLGLLAQKELDVSEPLSKRRTRLFGEAATPRRASSLFPLSNSSMMMQQQQHNYLQQQQYFQQQQQQYMQQYPQQFQQPMPEPVRDHTAEGDQETLAQRRHRLHTAEALTGGSPQIGSVAGGQYLHPGGADTRSMMSMRMSSLMVPAAGEDETLAQRRARIQAAMDADDDAPLGEVAARIHSQARQSSYGMGMGFGDMNSQLYLQQQQQQQQMQMAAMMGGGGGGLRTSRSMADLLRVTEATKLNLSTRVTNEALMSVMPQNSLLAQNDKVQASQRQSISNYNRRSSAITPAMLASHSDVNLLSGGGNAARGGFYGGAFNDGTGGVLPPPGNQTSMYPVQGVLSNPNMLVPGIGHAGAASRQSLGGMSLNMMNPNMMNPNMMNPNMMNPNMNMNMNMGAMGMPRGVPPGMKMGMGIEDRPAGPRDRIDRWRMSVMP